MKIYFINMLLIIIISLFIFPNTTSTRRKQLFIVICFIINFIFIGFRASTVGADTLVYMEGFNYIKYASVKELFSSSYNFEPGYIIFNKIISLAFSNPQSIIVVSAFFSLFSIYLFIYKYSKNITFSVFLFNTISGLQQSMTFLRQYLAIAILLFSIEFIRKRKFAKFLIVVLIATSFHKTSILFILVYFLANIKLNSKAIFTYIIGLITMMLFIDKIVIFALNYIYPNYVVMTEWLSLGGGYKFIIMHAVILIFALYLRNYGDGNTKLYQVYISIEIIQLAIFVASLKLGMISRLMITYEPFVLLIAPEIISRIQKKEIRFVSYIAVSIVSIGLAYILLKNTYIHNIPYEFMWQIRA